MAALGHVFESVFIFSEKVFQISARLKQHIVKKALYLSKIIAALIRTGIITNLVPTGHMLVRIMYNIRNKKLTATF